MRYKVINKLKNNLVNTISMCTPFPHSMCFSKPYKIYYCIYYNKHSLGLDYGDKKFGYGKTTG